jgi:hypothetical protein
MVMQRLVAEQLQNFLPDLLVAGGVQRPMPLLRCSTGMEAAVAGTAVPAAAAAAAAAAHQGCEWILLHHMFLQCSDCLQPPSWAEVQHKPHRLCCQEH